MKKITSLFSIVLVLLLFTGIPDGKAQFAGPDQTVCSTWATLNGQPLNGGTGIWTTTSNATIYSSNSPTTMVSNLSLGANQFTWTISGGANPGTGTVTITNDSVSANAGPDASVCSSTTSLNGNMPGAGSSGLWTTTSLDATILSPAQYNTMVENLSQGVNTFTWTVSNANCSASDQVVITNNSVTANAGPDLDICSSGTNLTGNEPPAGSSGSWTKISGTGIITNPDVRVTSVINIDAGTTSIFRWTITGNGCTGTDDVEVTNNSVTANAGANQDVCSNTTFLAASELPANATGMWTTTAPGVTIDTPTLYNTQVDNLNQGTNNFTWTVTRSACSNSDDVVITNNSVTANAGANFTVCETSATLNAAPPGANTIGQWSTNMPGITFVTPTLFNTEVTGLNQGANMLSWLVFGNGCSANDNVVVTNSSVTANAGADFSVCEPTTNMGATPPPQGATGSWTTGEMNVVIVTPTLYNTEITSLNQGPNLFTWTVANSNCDATDDVIVLNNSVTANAGADQDICENQTSLMGNQPAAGSGLWTKISGAGVITTPTSYNTTVTGIDAGTSSVFRWTITANNCTGYDEVTVTSNAVAANAGADFSVCEPATNMGATPPPQGATGSWTTGEMNVVIVTPTLYNTEITSLNQGANVFTWTVANSNCDATDDVTVLNNSVEANAGADQSVCVNEATLTGNTPPATGTGQWSVIFGSSTLSNPTSNVTGVTGLNVGMNKFKWTIEANTCSDSDTVIVTNNAISGVDAGPDKEICQNSTELNGSALSAGQTGTWTVEGGYGTFTSPELPTTQVSNIMAGENVYRWNVTNGECTFFDDVVITNNKVTTNAGPNQTVCINTTTLAAQIPGTGITGIWTTSSTSATIVNPTLFNTQVTGLAQGQNIFTWTVSKGTCSHSDDVQVLNNNPDEATTQLDMYVCQNFADITANNPLIGTGLWTLEGGTGLIEDPTSYTTTVTYLGSGVNTFRWTISLGTCSNYDDVAITNETVQAQAGTDVTTCDGAATLTASSPFPDSGHWSIVSGGGDITNPSIAVTQITNLVSGLTQVKWSVTNGICQDTDTVNVQNDMPSEAFAGEDQTLCIGETYLEAAPVIYGTGVWSVMSGAATFDNSTLHNTFVSGLGTGNNLLRWSVANNSCSDHDNVVITNNDFIIDAGEDQQLCRNYTYLNGSAPPLAETLWSFAAGSGAFEDATNRYTMVTDIAGGENKVYFYAEHNGCQKVDSLFLTNNKLFPDADYTINGLTVDFTDLTPGNPDTWYWTFGDGAFSNQQNPSHTYQQQGVYNACLGVMNSLTGCQAQVCGDIMVGDDACQAAFDYTINSNQVTFQDNSGGTAIINWYWTFGDGTYSDEQNPTHEYTEAGTYTVTLHIGTISGCTDVYAEEITIGTSSCELLADFTPFVNPASLLVDFVDESVADTITAWYWNFGDGATSFEQDPSHTYAAPGFYLVHLGITNNVCIDHKAKLIQVGQLECVANFSFSVSPEEYQVQFTNESSPTADTYYWDFGDGNVAVQPNPQHTYSGPGFYPVTLVVSNSNGLCSDMKTRIVQVGGGECNANFEVFVEPETTTAHFNSVAIGQNMNFIWSFGDGAVSTEADPVHDYPSAGFFTVTLTVINPATGCLAQTEQNVLINQQGNDLQADFFFLSDSLTNTVQFFDNSLGNVQSYLWDFNDGNTATNENPVHQFAEGGFHNVCLTVTNDEGLTSTLCKDVPVTSGCAANFGYSMDAGNPEVSFVNLSIGNTDTHTWEFEDGTTSTDENPVHTFPETGYYLVSLTASNSTTGCESEKTRLVNAGAGNNGFQNDFTFFQNPNPDTKDGYPADFIGATFGNAPSLMWNFGDGGTNSSSLTPTYTYENTGDYEVCFTVSDPVNEMQNIVCKDVVITEGSGVQLLDEIHATMDAYPNPVSDILQVDYTTAKQADVDIAIFDTQGHRVATLRHAEHPAGNFSLQTNVSGLPQGVYYIRLTTEHSRLSQKIIVTGN